MNLRSNNMRARLLMAHCRKYAQDATNRTYDTYQFQQRVVTDAAGVEHDQTFFADGYVLLDVSGYIAQITGDVDVDHWHNTAVADFRRVDVARAWDTWVAEDEAQPGDELEPLNLYTYIGDKLCQIFAVVGSQTDDPATPAWRVLIDTALLTLFTPSRDALFDDGYDLRMFASARIAVRNAHGRLLGYVMPMADGYRRAHRHEGQLQACPMCGGDGAYHPVSTHETAAV